MHTLNPDSAETCQLLEQIQNGDTQALEDLLQRYRPFLRDFIDVRLDNKVAGRIDPSDVVQETQLTLVRRIDDFLQRRPMPFHLWVRKTAYQQLLDLRKHHVQRQRRSVKKELPLPQRSSLLLARPFLTKEASPSEEMQVKELAKHVAKAVDQLSDTDREVLLMRQAEELSFEEIGCLLDLEPAAARKRFGRALLRLQKMLEQKGLLE